MRIITISNYYKNNSCNKNSIIVIIIMIIFIIINHYFSRNDDDILLLLYLSTKRVSVNIYNFVNIILNKQVRIFYFLAIGVAFYFCYIAIIITIIIDWFLFSVFDTTLSFVVTNVFLYANYYYVAQISVFNCIVIYSHTASPLFHENIYITLEVPAQRPFPRKRSKKETFSRCGRGSVAAADVSSNADRHSTTTIKGWLLSTSPPLALINYFRLAGIRCMIGAWWVGWGWVWSAFRGGRCEGTPGWACSPPLTVNLIVCWSAGLPGIANLVYFWLFWGLARWHGEAAWLFFRWMGVLGDRCVALVAGGLFIWWDLIHNKVLNRQFIRLIGGRRFYPRIECVRFPSPECKSVHCAEKGNPQARVYFCRDLGGIQIT